MPGDRAVASDSGGGGRAVAVAVGLRFLVQLVEDHTLPQTALADLQRLAEKLTDLFEDEHAGGENLDPARVEFEALGDLGGRIAGEHADAALERLVLEHGADE